MVEHQKDKTDLHHGGIGHALKRNRNAVLLELRGNAVHIGIRAAQDSHVRRADSTKFPGVLVKDFPDGRLSVEDLPHFGCQCGDGLVFGRGRRSSRHAVLLWLPGPERSVPVLYIRDAFRQGLLAERIQHNVIPVHFRENIHEYVVGELDQWLQRTP